MICLRTTLGPYVPASQEMLLKYRLGHLSVYKQPSYRTVSGIPYITL